MKTMSRLAECIAFLFSSCAIVLGDQSITCESNSFAYTVCDLNAHYNTIVKTKQISGSPCTMGGSFGLSGNLIWVSNGCRGTFYVSNTETTPSLETTAPNYFTTTSTAKTTTSEHTTAALVVYTESSSKFATTTANFTVTSERSVALYTTIDDHTDKPTNSTLHNGLCKCRCIITTDTQNLSAILRELRKKLAVDKSKLSSVIRRKTSASDPRTSAAVIGYSGSAFLVMFVMLIVTIDLITLFQYFSSKTRPAVPVTC